MEQIRKSFAQELDELKRSILEMGAMGEELIKGSVKAFLERDPELARRVVADDEDIDQKELEIESRCMRLFALQQPMASDLRTIPALKPTAWTSPAWPTK